MDSEEKRRGSELKCIAPHCNRYIVVMSEVPLGSSRHGKNNEKCKSSNYYPYTRSVIDFPAYIGTHAQTSPGMTSTSFKDTIL